MNEQLKQFNVGDIVSGKVIHIESLQAIVQIEGGELVNIPKEAIFNLEQETIKNILRINQTYEFFVLEDKSCRFGKYGELYLSLIALKRYRTRERIEQLATENVTIYSEVIKAYDYGVLVNIESQDFLVSNIHLKTNKSNQELVGSIIPLKIITFNNQYDYVFSHRWALTDRKQTENKFYARGDIVTGKVIKLEEDHALIDIGAEKLAYLALGYMSYAINHPTDVLHLNLIREFIVSIVYHQRHTTLSLSIVDLERQIGWQRLEQIYKEKAIFFAKPFVKQRDNGFLVKAEGMRAFLPNNCLGTNVTSEEVLNKTIPLQILECDRDRNRLVVSHCRALFRLGLINIKVGDLVSGKVIAVKEYGLFVNIGDINVLLHISEISQAAIGGIDLNTIFQINENIKAIVVWMDVRKGRVLISTKELELEPGDMLKNKYSVYQTAEKMAARYRTLVIKKLNTSEQ